MPLPSLFLPCLPSTHPLFPSLLLSLPGAGKFCLGQISEGRPGDNIFIPTWPRNHSHHGTVYPLLQNVCLLVSLIVGEEIRTPAGHSGQLLPAPSSSFHFCPVFIPLSYSIPFSLPQARLYPHSTITVWYNPAINILNPPSLTVKASPIVLPGPDAGLKQGLTQSADQWSLILSGRPHNVLTVTVAHTASFHIATMHKNCQQL